MTKNSQPNDNPEMGDEAGPDGRLPNGRYAPRRSGNLKGRPRKGSKKTTMTEDMLKVLSQKVGLRKNGRMKRVTQLVAMTERFSNDAMDGDLDAVRALTSLIRAVQGLEQRGARKGAAGAVSVDPEVQEADAVMHDVLAEYERRVLESSQGEDQAA